MLNMNGWLTGFGHDLKYAIRGLAKSRMFTLPARRRAGLSLRRHWIFYNL